MSRDAQRDVERSSTRRPELCCSHWTHQPLFRTPFPFVATLCYAHRDRLQIKVTVSGHVYITERQLIPRDFQDHFAASITLFEKLKGFFQCVQGEDFINMNLDRSAVHKLRNPSQGVRRDMSHLSNGRDPV